MAEFSLSPFTTELELELNDYRQKFGETAGTELLARAAEADDSYGKKNLTDAQKAQRLAEVVAWARRELKIQNEEIERLMVSVGTVSEASFECGYVLSSVLLAAAVSNAQAHTRVHAALVAADAAKSFDRLVAADDAKSLGRFRDAKAAYVDCLESLRLMARFFVVDEDRIRELESYILGAWSELRMLLGETGDILDLSEDPPAETLLEHVIWNTDFGPHNSGHLPQTDAMARLVIRLEHWLEAQGGDASRLAAAWLTVIRASTSIPDRDKEEFSKARCMVTCADALLETGSYEAALPLYAEATRYLKGMFMPLYTHAQINQSLALYQLGRMEEARISFGEVDAQKLEQLAGIVLTVQAEWARYLAVRYVLRADDAPSEEAAQVQAAVEEKVVEIGRLLVGSADGRIGHLRSLFVGQISRDVAAILALDNYR
jgi:tetratricopeptide (TPR) repeat protein